MIRELKPRSVLDVGIGLGKWGLMVREYVDCWHYQRFYQEEWQTNLVGVEIHRAYKNPVWNIYNDIWLGDVRQLLPQIRERHGLFDLVVMVDVLEHFNRDDGLYLLAELYNASCKVLVSYSNVEQKDVRDNPHEDHLSKWSGADFMPFMNDVRGYYPRLAGSDEEGFGLFCI